MAIDRRNALVLALLVIVLAALVYRALPGAGTSGTKAAASNQQSAAARSGRGAVKPNGGAPDVHLEALADDKPAPSAAERNLFRFRPKAPPRPPQAARPTTPAIAEPAPAAPSGPPPPPPITLRFIGILEHGAGQPKIAVLSDGQGPPMFGVEGGTVAGRYRVLRIGVESVELSYLDGRGRQTIRLTGG
jgi:hypothetical protein